MQTDVLTPQSVFYKVIRYDIPVFQRPYIWTQEQQWEPLWEDVTALAETIVEKGHADPHFMGAIVLQQILNQMSSIETRVVVDGQQRLTTIQLLLDAIQEFCVDRGYEGPAERLQALVQNPKAFTGSEPDLAFKVWPTEYDQSAFRHAMQNDLDSDDYKANRIVLAHNYFKSQVKQWLDQPPQNENPEKFVVALERAVRDYLEVAVINLNQNDNPHVIFETLNARGTPLLPSDKVKNHILHKAGVGIGYEDDQMTSDATRLWAFNEGYWREEIGRGHQRRPRIDIYLNNWLVLRNGSEIRAHQEFQAFERYVEEVEGEQSIQQIAADIAQLGEIYQSIDRCNLPEIQTFLLRRRVMNAGAVIPALLSLLSSDLPEAELRKGITALESYLVRRMVCGWSARGYSQLFIGLVAELKQRGPQSASSKVIEYLAKREAIGNKWPKDSELLDAFLRNPLYQWLTVGRVNLILQGIERELMSPLAETQSLPDGLQIEHVMPQGWHQHWHLSADIQDEEQAIADRRRLIHSIGNLTLVTGPLNSKLSNAPWKEKRVTLNDHTVLFLNKDLLKEAPEVWNEATIEKRSRRLYEAAAKVWPYADAIK